MIVKTRCNSLCSIRENNYGKSLSKFNRLLAEAQKDFPDLKDSDVEVVTYGGERLKHIMAIEFVPRGHSIPDTYTVVNEVELTL